MGTVVSMLISSLFFFPMWCRWNSLKIKAKESALSAHKQMQERSRVSFPASRGVGTCISASSPRLGLAAQPSHFLFPLYNDTLWKIKEIKIAKHLCIYIACKIPFHVIELIFVLIRDTYTLHIKLNIHWFLWEVWSPSWAVV